MRVLLVDNHDSYTYNLFQLIAEVAGAEPAVLTNDDPAWDGFDFADLDAVVVSPGPGRPQHPRDLGRVPELLAATPLPVLGVCLGHQAIGVAFGATVDRAPELLHGKTSTVFHRNTSVLQGLPDPFTATRYHSLTILPETLPETLQVTAQTRSGIIMGIRHTELPIHGVQFHPESILTEGGHRMLANWLGFCGTAPDEALVRRLENEVADAVSAATARATNRTPA